MPAGAIRAADLFCGAGGTSEGLARACASIGRPLSLLAVNHWKIAVSTHKRNHPDHRHLCADLESINPREVVPGGRLQLLVASPECTHHSSARGGRPMCDQKRASAWHVLRWAEQLYVETVLIENVPEFMSWGPIGASGRPLKSKRGQTFRAFVSALESLGYRVEHRILCAADYGDPTTRRRLFLIARRPAHRRIPWPEPTHARTPGLFARRPWRSAREVIDWSIPGESIFRRRRPLASKTLARIIAGLEKFGGPQLKPFVYQLTHGGRSLSIDSPLPTVTGANRGELGIVQPFVLSQQSGGIPRSTDDPLQTVAAKGAISLVRPYLIPFRSERHGQSSRTHDIDDPVPTVTAGATGFGLCRPFLTRYNGTGGPLSTDDPMPTLTAKDRFGLCEPFLVPNNENNIPKSIDDPVPTVTGGRRLYLAQPVIDGVALDVTFRMLQPHELAAAQGFPDGYEFDGNRGEQIRQIGNAVPVGLATALCRAILDGSESSESPASEEVA